MNRKGESAAVISGVGQSAVGRRLGRSGIDLTVEAVRNAVAHAGLTLDDIDGIATYPGQKLDDSGFSPCGVGDLREALRLDVRWFLGAVETSAQMGAIFNAVAAVGAGFANHVVCFRTLTEASARAKRQASEAGSGAATAAGVEPVPRMGGRLSWQYPFGGVSPVTWMAMNAQRYMHEYGLTREQLAGVALNARTNAMSNPKAVYRTPLTLDEYLGSRMVSSPLCLYDCDVPVDGSTAVIVSRRDAADDLANPVRIEAIGCGQRQRDSWDQWDDLSIMNQVDSAQSLWKRTDLTTKDVDCALLYDGFTILTVFWLEALGFCGRGEGGAFVAEGIGREGGLPLNTHGGQLSAGRTHGFGFVHEAVLQLRDEAEDRQVSNAEVAVVATGSGPPGTGCMLLTRS